MSEIGEYALVNGEISKSGAVKLSGFDRAFLFAHAAYEVTAVYNGRLICWPEHYERLARTLDGLEIPNPFKNSAQGERFHQELMDQNKMAEGLIYLQVTGGDYGFRDFAGPEVFKPNFFMFVTPKRLIGAVAQNGLKAITLPDERWKRRDWKTTQLLSQTQAYRAARTQNADTALMHENGLITEAASANVWMVTDDGRLVTRDLSQALLPGITRQTVLELMQKADRTVEERAFSVEEAKQAAELFTTSTGAIIAPIVELDAQPVGTGLPGPATRLVQRTYYEAIGADVEAVAPWALV